MRVRSLAAALMSVASIAGGHESFLTPHLGPHDHSHTNSNGEHAVNLQLDVVSGGRLTGFDVGGDRARLWETGVGVTVGLTEWLALSADARYGWFDGTSRADGWLPPTAALEAHVPLRGGWEVGIGLGVQFPGTAPLGEDEWEFSPGVELRYESARWYVALDVELSLVEGEGAHEDHAAEEKAHEPGAESDDQSSHHSEAEDHVEIHEIIDPHAEVEIDWSAALGTQFFDGQVAAEARVQASHVVQGESDSESFFRVGARLVYHVDKACAVFLEGSLPVGSARRNEWQTDFGVRLRF